MTGNDPDAHAAIPAEPEQVSQESGRPWLFVHIPRTGGTSVRSALKQFGDAYGAAASHRGHAGAQEQIDAMGRERWGELTTFALVRDPFARLVSCWAMAFAQEPERVMGVEAFREWVAFGCPLPNRLNLWLGPSRTEGRRLWIHAPQVEWLSYGGEIVVSQIFKLEHIYRDWTSILRCAGIEAMLLVHANASEHAETEAYYDEATRELVRERYAADFEALNYDRRCDPWHGPTSLSESS